MTKFDLTRRLAAEGLGTALLVAAVVGSGIMAQKLTNDVALQLLCNALPTGAVLVVLISILGPISGAHFNPAVSGVFLLRKELERQEAVSYMLVQIAGGLAGTVVAHLMFGLPPLELSTKIRTGAAQWFSEAIAAFGLVLTILLGVRFQKQAVAWLVGLYITAAYWFTASTSFANPAVTIARSLTNTFAGIRPDHIVAFIVAQFVGAFLAAGFAKWLLAPDEVRSSPAQMPRRDHPNELSFEPAKVESDEYS